MAKAAKKLDDLFHDTLKDIYFAEKKILAALPKMANAAHDEELKFKATARRNRMLGQWAAEKLGLSGADADAYAREVVLAALEGPGVLAKLRKDFDAKGVAQSDHQISRTMTEFMEKAVADIKAGK